MTQPFDPYAPPPAGSPAPSTTPLYDAYATANQARRLRVPEGLATSVVVLSSVFLAVQVLSTALSFGAVEAYAAAADPMDVFTAYDAVAGLLSAVMLAAFIVSCLWLNECRKFAVAVKPTYRHQRGPVWVWLGWVVPVVSLWFPYQVVRDVRRSTIRGSSGLAGWWSTWLIGNFASYQATLVTMRGEDPVMLPFYELVAAVTLLIAFVCWLRIVRELTAAQRAHVAALDGMAG